MLRKWYICLIGVLLTAMAVAQEPENIVTEGSDVEDEQFLDGIVKRTLIEQSRILPWDNPREADVPWERMIWRVIDIREKLNLPFAYPDMLFVQILFDAAKAGEVAIFQDEDFKEPLDPQEIDQLLFRVDTTEVIDLETYETKLVVTVNELNYADIKRIRVKEVWYFDENTSRMKVRILGLSPIKDEYTEFGEFKYEWPMFWVYYPQARQLLGRHRAFIENNDAAPITWENMFEMRKFSSYIFKATNVFGNRIQDYSYLANDPIGQLLESDRIKADLFNFEHDLWSW